MASLLLRQALLLRVCFHNYQRFAAGAVAARHRLWCSAAANSPSDKADDKTSSASIGNARKALFPPSQPRWEDEPDYRKWKDTEEAILKDIEPTVLLAKDILHSRRYMDGARLSAEDEKVVVQKLLAYHPHSEDKIGCGLESIMFFPPWEGVCMSHISVEARMISLYDIF
ncbi:uncharacterized protein LOC109818491 isoform X2 [Cajanus cajan]|uniref:uncharacterized protein LOC109818491 isoform X2 n=1 Tax=Cajanus cajan TaxID=3821 RepID=UPI0010FBB5DC|nr:uncharacterized protein LOC109818491 isoform X2 [Cajanus cajan]